MENGIHEKLAKIQKELKAPKNQVNKFGGFNYRSCEDILEALKPLLDGAVLTITDEVVLIGDRYYIKATATLAQGDQNVSTAAYAREAQTKKGMDEAQITGASSSYARKYALNGLFCIDDVKDHDSQNNKNNEAPKVSPITDTQHSTLIDMLTEKGINDKEEKLCGILSIESLEKLPADRYDEAVNLIKKAKGKE